MTWLVIVALILCFPVGVVIGTMIVRLIPCYCDRCGRKYRRGNLDKHFANDCTPHVRTLWKNRF